MARREAYRPEPGQGEQQECARGTYCAGYRLVPDAAGINRRTPGLTYQGFCVADTALIAEKLGELPAAFGRLEADLGSPVRRGEMIRVPFGPAIPLSEYYDGLIRQIAPGLRAWESRVAEIKHLSADLAPPLSLDGVRTAAGTLGRHLSVLLALQPAWMSLTIPRPPGRAGMPPSLADLEEQYGDCEIVRFTIDSVTVMAQRSGTDAGLEIFGWHRKCDLALGETAARPELLDGIPCRVCGDLGLARAEPPSDPAAEPDWSRCPNLACGDRMDLKTYRAWVARYEAWARSAGPLTCQRCLDDHHSWCIYGGCECATAGHPGGVLAGSS